MINDQSQSPQSITESKIPLYVDLDGTLIKSDMLHESVILLMKLNLLYIFMLPFWLLKGKANLKYQIARHVNIDASLLPYNASFLQYLKSQAAQGRALYLATASNEKYANNVAEHLGIFRGILASGDKINLTGRNKCDAIARHNQQQTGNNEYDYAGNAKVDLKVWSAARKAIVVNPHGGVIPELEKTGKLEQTFKENKFTVLSYIKAIRVHQWLKNLLILVPVLTAHLWSDKTAVMQALLAVLAFSLCASSVYVLNDMLDLAADRAHPRKRNRPFASGAIPLTHGMVLLFVALAAGFYIASKLSVYFIICLLIYYFITLAYSFYLKSLIVLDVITLACLYTIRIIAGMVAIAVVPSFWLIAFSMFLFFSLALLKRCSELDTAQKLNVGKAWGRGYLVEDSSLLYAMGVANGYLSVLVLALFINSPDIAQRYTHPIGLWLLCPLVLFWVSYMWFKAWRGQVSDDPLVFAIMDKGSQFVLLCCVLVSVLSV